MSNAPLRRTIRIRALSRGFRAGAGNCVAEVAAVDDVTLEIRSGEVFVIAGSAGAGKTSLMMCAAGLLRCDAGVIDRGLPVVYRDLSRMRGEIADLPANAALFLDSVDRAPLAIAAILPDLLDDALENQCAVVLAGRDAGECVSMIPAGSTVTVVHMRRGRVGSTGAGAVHRVAEGRGGGR